MFATGGMLPWHQTQPGRELAPTAEAARFYHRGGDGCGDDRADARNARQALADGVAFVPGHELLLDSPQPPPPAAQSVRPKQANTRDICRQTPSVLIWWANRLPSASHARAARLFADVAHHALSSENAALRHQVAGLRG